ncbi:MAG TPA: hypothetical protein VG455_04625 [Acidimicrobiales bacterium]|nr:hypothetical protein [Acidimicrobiales bacterium]
MPVPLTTEERLLAGLLALVGAGASFALTIVLFGFVALAGLLLALLGLGLLLSPDRRGPAAAVLVIAAVVLSGPLAYLGLALF